MVSFFYFFYIDISFVTREKLTPDRLRLEGGTSEAVSTRYACSRAEISSERKITDFRAGLSI